MFQKADFFFQAYHAITLGFYENELVRRLDPARRTIGQVLHEDIAVPLGIGEEVYIGTPSSVPDDRLGHVNRAALAAQQAGRDLTVDYILATDPGAVADFQAFCRTTGNELVEHSEEGGVYRFLIRKTA